MSKKRSTNKNDRTTKPARVITVNREDLTRVEGVNGTPAVLWRNPKSRTA